MKDISHRMQTKKEKAKQKGFERKTNNSEEFNRNNKIKWNFENKSNHHNIVIWNTYFPYTEDVINIENASIRKYFWIWNTDFCIFSAKYF